MDFKTLKTYIKQYSDYGPIRREFNTCLLEAGNHNAIAPVQRILSAGAAATKRKSSFAPAESDVHSDTKRSRVPFFRVPSWQENMHEKAESALVTQEHLHRFLPGKCESIGFDQRGRVCYIAAAIPVIVYMYFPILSTPMKRFMFDLITTTPGYTESKKKAGVMYQTDGFSHIKQDSPSYKELNRIYLQLQTKIRKTKIRKKAEPKRIGQGGGHTIIFITAMILHNKGNCVFLQSWKYPFEKLSSCRVYRNDAFMITKEITDTPIPGKESVHIIKIKPEKTYTGRHRYTFFTEQNRERSYNFIVNVYKKTSRMFEADKSQIFMLLRTNRRDKEGRLHTHITLIQYCTTEGKDPIILLCHRGRCKPFQEYIIEPYFNNKRSYIRELFVCIPFGHTTDEDPETSEASESYDSEDEFSSE